MRRVHALLENSATRNMLHENRGLVMEASNDLCKFYNVMQNYIAENIVEFLDESLEETSKNIYTFSTFATKQFLNEIAAIYGGHIHKTEVLKEAAKTEFV